MAEDTLTLSVFYQGWHDYQKLLIKALASLSSEYDLHHGGEISLILGIHGLEAPTL